MCANGADVMTDLLRRDRERRRRGRLLGQIGVLERKRDKIGASPVGLARERWFRLNSKVKKLKQELNQLVLL